MHFEVAWREAGVTNDIHKEQVSSSLPSDLAHEYQEVSDWVNELFQRYCDRVVVKVIDAASLEGFIRSLQYKVRKFPAIIVNQKARFPGGSFQAAGEEIARQLADLETVHN